MVLEFLEHWDPDLSMPRRYADIVEMCGLRSSVLLGLRMAWFSRIHLCLLLAPRWRYCSFPPTFHVKDTNILHLSLSHTCVSHTQIHTHHKKIVNLCTCALLIFALQVLNVCFLLTDVAVGDTLCISIYCAPPPPFLLSVLP